MTFTETNLKGCFLIEPKLFLDERGYFMESFNERNFQEKTGTSAHLVQDNESKSTKGVLRGLHYQKPMQAKLVFVIKGKIQDIVLDIDKNSKTFGK